MRYSHYLVGLLSLFIGISRAAQRSEWERSWPNSNKDFGFDEKELYDEDGSADGGDPYDNGYDYNWRADDEDAGDYSGGEFSYEEDGSGVNGLHPPTDSLTECQQQEMKAKAAKRKAKPYDYIPRCTDSGDYDAKQCDMTGQCWCVNYHGQEIPDTRKNNADVWCQGRDRSIVYDIDDPITIDGDDFDKPIVKVEDTGLGTKIGQDDGDDRASNEQGDKDDLLVPATQPTHRAAFLSQPLILAGIIAFAVVCLLCAVLLVMFIVYRMRKKDEGSYALDEPKRSPAHPYQRAPTKEYFA